MERQREGEERRAERWKTSASFFAHRSAPGSPFLHSEINPVKQPQSLDRKSSFLSSSELEDQSRVPGLAAGNNSQEKKKERKKETDRK